MGEEIDLLDLDVEYQSENEAVEEAVIRVLQRARLEGWRARNLYVGCVHLNTLLEEVRKEIKDVGTSRLERILQTLEAQGRVSVVARRIYCLRDS